MPNAALHTQRYVRQRRGGATAGHKCPACRGSVASSGLAWLIGVWRTIEPSTTAAKNRRRDARLLLLLRDLQQAVVDIALRSGNHLVRDEAHGLLHSAVLHILINPKHLRHHTLEPLHRLAKFT